MESKAPRLFFRGLFCENPHVSTVLSCQGMWRITGWHHWRLALTVPKTVVDPSRVHGSMGWSVYFWSNYSDFTRLFTPKGSVLEGKSQKFQGNVGWWNIIIWPDIYLSMNGTVNGSEIRRAPVEVGSLSHYLQGFFNPRWCRISSINSMNGWCFMAIV